MKRRQFITLVGGAAAASLPLVARAQQPAKVPTIGFLGPASPEIARQWVAAFEARLGELGWIKDRTVAIQYRWAEAQAERYREIAAELVALKVDVIVTWASAPVLAAKQATVAIPIMFAAQMDPVGAGVVASLARPGGNVTGLSLQQTDTTGNRLELLREAVGGLGRLAIMANVGAAGAPATMSTRSCAGPGRPTSRSSSRRNSISSSTSRPQGHSASMCRRRCSPPPTR
jgi:putative ABC transport system substrate-binding protein